jgi:beta-glucuronidase
MIKEQFRFFYATLIIVAGIINSTIAQENKNLAPLLTNVENRNAVSLDGQWHIIIDRYENGYYDYRRKPTPNGYFKNRKPSSKSDLVEYDFDTSPVINVPGDWNTQMPELYYYEGTVWYKKSFDYKKNKDARTFLYFGAVNYNAVVGLNGEVLGEHIGGFTPFNFDITDKLKDGENFIVIKVDNTRQKDGVPTLKTDWWNYGGITRSVKLIEVPKDFIQDYFIHLEKGSMRKIGGWIKLNKQEAGQQVTLNIPELKIRKQLTTNINGLTNFEFDAKPELWSPENPKLYKVELTAGNDKIQDQIGFRDIEVKEDNILLNGKPVYLRGVCIHEEAPYRTGRAFNKEDAATLLGWAKDMGCNFVRLAHYPHNENMIRTAEKMGILVWSEIPVYWTIDFTDDKVYKNAETQLTEEITRDKNRAPIIIWSMANETPVSNARNEFLKKLVDHTRELDNTRLVSAALEKHNKSDNPLISVVDDPFGQYLDVLSFNEYVGWYDGPPDKCDKTTWEIKYNKPIIISEFGGGALQGYHADKDTRWSEEFQKNLYKKQIDMLDKMPHLRGTTPWILMDFRSPNRVLPKIQDGWNRKGLISEQGNKKEAFYVMQKWYSELKAKWAK